MKKSLISDFFDSQNGQRFSVYANLCGVIGFALGAHHAYGQGSSGAGLWLTMVSAGCGFLAGLSAHKLNNMSPEETQEETLTLE